MTVFKGMFLFDIAEQPIGQWENQLGYCGMMEVWKCRSRNNVLTIEPDEDSGEIEVWIANDTSGSWEPLGFFKTEMQAERFAKRWMRENKEGWL